MGAHRWRDWKSLFAIDRRGTARLTICIGPWALKLARNATGLRATVSKLIYGSGQAKRDATCFARCSLGFRSDSESSCSGQSHCLNPRKMS
jgi:hypothetical protein